MSTTTSNLGLIKPEIIDNGRQTILDLAVNFQKLDDASDIYASEEPTSGDWEQDRLVYLRNRTVGGYVGLINIRAGRAAKKWDSLAPYNVNDEIVPLTNNGHYYVCIQSGYSSPFEPSWLVAAQTVTEDTRNRTTWQPTKAYDLNEIVVPTILNDRFYVCTVAGTSGSNEPTWSTNDGVSTSDSGVVWMTYRIVKWIESGTSAHFRPFGKID